MSEMNSNLNMLDNERKAEHNYELSGKIMLTAIIILFIFIIIMLCLHVLIRWYLQRLRHRQHLHRTRNFRRQHLIFYVDPDAPATLTLAVSHGLDASVISSLPIFKFSPANYPDQTVECAVCLSEFEDGETGRVLPKCNHSFHIDCIDMWFQSHSTCPLCRAPVEPPPLQVNRPEPELVIGSSSDEEINRSESAVSSSFSSEKQSSYVTIEIPGRNESQSQRFAVGESSCDSPSSFRSPMSRVLSFTRILSRERKPSVSSTSSDCVGVNGSVIELETERVGTEETQ